MATKITFIATVKREGDAGSIRGKIPAGLIKAIGAGEGDGIQFVVNGTTLVGAHVLHGKALRLAQREAEGLRGSPTPVKKAVTKPSKAPTPVKPVRKFAAAVSKKNNGRKPLPVRKASKRRTEVEYDAPPVRLKKKKGNFAKALRK